MAKALLVWRRHSVHWQQLTNIGADSSRYFTAPQKQEPVREYYIRLSAV